MKRTKQWLSLLLSLIMVVSMFTIDALPVEAATTPSKISDSEANDKIYKLYEILGEGSYFTTTHTSACGSKSSGHSCGNCKLSSILAKTWFKEKFGSLSVSQFPVTYYSDGIAHGPDGWSCFGFASFAEWYVFHTSQTDKVTTSYIGTFSYNYSNSSNYIKTGDLIRLDDGHSAIAISCDSTGVRVLDSNWSGNYNCQVYIHTIKYTSRNKVSISRSTNSSASTIGNISTNPDDYTMPTSTIYYTSPTMKGSTVSWVQAVLYQLGYSIDVDGSYGKNSEAVVKQFQSAYGLEVDGRVGPATRAKLLELWNEKKHTHSYSVYAESSHPHKEYNKCSCGDVQYTGQVFASWENTGYEAAHPHKGYRSCWCGYKEYTGEYKTVYTCDSCLPEKPVLTVVPGTGTEQTTFTWEAASGADCYELIIYKSGNDTPLHWLFNLTTTQYKLLLSPGDYIGYVVSLNNDLIDTSNYFVYSDKVEFSVEDSGEHVHEYSSLGFPSSCTEYGYIIYACTCGDSYREDLTTLGEHDYFDTSINLVSLSSRKIRFAGYPCLECNTAKDCKIIYPDGTAKKFYLPHGAKYSEYMKPTSIELVASVENSKEKSVGFSWRTIGGADKYELTVYRSDELVETVYSTLPDCMWNFETDGEYIIVVTALNVKGEVVAVSDVIDLKIIAVLADNFGYYGDADGDRYINIKDATLIQKWIAKIASIGEFELMCADVNDDNVVNIKDASEIQKYCANIEINSIINNECWLSGTLYDIMLEN